MSTWTFTVGVLARVALPAFAVTVPQRTDIKKPESTADRHLWFQGQSLLPMGNKQNGMKL